MKMEKKYIFLDVDGTLYSSRIAGVPASARKAIDLARANGSKVFLCTGRSLAECSKYLNDPLDGFVFGAGAMVYAEHKRIYDRPLDPEDVLAIEHFLEENGFGWSLEGQAGAYVNEEAYEFLLPYFSAGKQPRSVMVQQMMDNGMFPAGYMDPQEKIYKICGFTTKIIDDMEPIRAKVDPKYSLLVTLKSESGTGCELNYKEITKATGIRRVLDFYGADWNDACAIGDSENDIPMIEACGTGIAMGNAFEHVKEKADFVTTDILDDGIWNAFRHIGVI